MNLMGRIYRNPSTNSGVTSDMPYTMSNQGSQGTGIFKQLSGYEFQLYKLASANNLLTIGLESGDYVKFTLNQASIDHNQLTNYDAAKHFLQSAITQVGTIATGVWNGTVIAVANGGTGTANGSITGTGALAFIAGGAGQNVTLTPSATGRIVLARTTHFNTISAHGSPTAGDVYSDGENLYFYDGVTGTWVDVTASAIGSATITLAKQASGTYVLPTAVGKTNQIYSVVKSNASATVLNVDGAGSETIDNALKVQLRRQYQQWTGVSDGANWLTIAKDASVFDITKYGATGDPTDTTSANAAFTAILAAISTSEAEYNVIYIPKGVYYLTSTVTIDITQKLSIIGDGYGTQLYMAADDHLFTINGYSVSGRSTAHVRFENLYLISLATSSGKSLMNLIRVSCSYFNNIIMAGGDRGFNLQGCLENHFIDCRVDASGLGYGSSPAMTWFACLDEYSGVQSNANTFDNCSARGGEAFTENGIYFNGNGEGDIYILNSRFQGVTGYGIYLISVIDGIEIRNCHFEGISAYTGIRMLSCGPATIENNKITGTTAIGIRISNCILVEIAKNYISAEVYINETNSRCRFYYNRQGAVGSAERTWAIDNAICDCWGNSSSISVWWGASGKRSYLPVNIVEGSMETWSGGVASPPDGFTYFKSSAEISQEATSVCVGTYAARVTVQTGQTQAALKWVVTNYAQRAYPDAVNYSSENYKWTKNGTTYEYYLEAIGGGDPGLPGQPLGVIINGYPRLEASANLLSYNEWDYAYNSVIGAYTLYVRLNDDTSPDTKASGYVKGIYKRYPLTLSAWVYKPPASENGVNPAIFVGVSRAWISDTTATYNFGFSIPSEQWTRITKTIYLHENAHAMNVHFGIYSGDPADCVIFDGIEILEGDSCSPRYCGQ